MTPNRDRFPPLDPEVIGPTRDALHGYAQVIGRWAEAKRRRRKHWWHISLRPSVHGLTTGIIRDVVDFQLELDFDNGAINVLHERGNMSLDLAGQPADEVSAFVREQLAEVGVEPILEEEAGNDVAQPDFSMEVARDLHRANASVAACLEELRAGIREETSPIQVWPHHFDLSMVWLPGPRVEGVDPEDEESADKQMNFGFLFGDSFVTEPYFYVTAYPHPDGLETTALPDGARWCLDGFKGVVATYAEVVSQPEPARYLSTLWAILLQAGRGKLAARNA